MFNKSVPEATTIQDQKFTFKTTSDKNIAIVEICKLAQFDSRYAKIAFTEVFNEITSCVNAEQYAVIAMPFRDNDNNYKEVPVGYVLWGSFNDITLAIYAKGIRAISPIEYKSGADKWVVQFSSPFGFQDEVFNQVKDKFPDLFREDKLLAIDLLEQIPYLRNNSKHK
jgi:hemolysin-activating ACP:hemolysin acyltransferase